MKRLLLLSTLLTAACATTNQSAEETVKPREAMPVAETRKFTEAVSAVVAGKLKPGKCNDQQSKLKTDWSWKKAMEAASSCYRDKNLAAVNDIAQNLATREPTTPWGPYWMALLAYDAGQFERAQWMIELAYSRGTESSVINYLRGQIQWNDKKYKESLESFEKAAEKDPSFAPVQVFLGQIYYQDQEPEKALEKFRLALQADPKNPYALYGFAECKLQLKSTEEALDALSTLGGRDPSDARYYQRMADVHQNILQNSQAALDDYKKLQKNVRAGLVQKNLDPQFEVKLKQLEEQVRAQAQVVPPRSVATSKEK